MADHTTCLYSADGLDIPALVAHHKERPLIEYKGEGAEHLEQDASLYTECDVLVPAAVGSVIDCALPTLLSQLGAFPAIAAGPSGLHRACSVGLPCDVPAVDTCRQLCQGLGTKVLAAYLSALSRWRSDTVLTGYGAAADENVDNLRCKYVVEAANAPITPTADMHLKMKGIHVLPDIYANAGGVIVSFFEWTQNLNNFRCGPLPRMHCLPLLHVCVDCTVTLDGGTPAVRWNCCQDKSLGCVAGCQWHCHATMPTQVPN